jgi:Kdo2-lipid IVA lauroyltransferase/acyltransferase
MIPQKGRVAEGILASFYYLLKLLPTEYASEIGSRGFRWNARTNLKQAVLSAKANLRRHRPEADEAAIEAMVDAFYDAVGRVAAEFAVMHRFFDENRITVCNEAGLMAAAGKRPIVALCVHTGNWEVFSPVFQKLGIQLNSIIAPPETGFERLVVENTRRRFGVRTLLPTASGTREAVRILRANGLVSMFPDEARDGVSMAPLFGRTPHARGNLAVAARLARMAGAALVMGHCRRTAKCRFDLTFSDIFEMPRQGEKPDILADVAFLNGRIEPIVQSEIPRWYFLDDQIVPIAVNDEKIN